MNPLHLTNRMFAATVLVTLALPAVAETRLDIFDEVVETVAEQFFDPAMNGLDWPAVAAEHRARISVEMDRESFAAEVNAMLERLEASHTLYLTRDNPNWYQLAGVFVAGTPAIAEEMAPFLDSGRPVYTGIGIFTDETDEGTFVTDVLAGYPAAAAGILVGDRIVTVEGAPFHPIHAFAGREGTPTEVAIERRPGETFNISVTPVALDGTTMFQDAMRASVRVVPKDGVDIGYVHLWSYAGQAYQDILRSELLYGELSRADALVLDIRGGWGGANPSYLNLFTKQNVEMTSIGREGSANTYASAWTKPVVLLIDGGARSGKELIAHGFRSLGKGPVVGETTAGAVLAGRFNVLSDGSILYVAVFDVLVDELRLEGVGVTPDIVVPFNRPYAAGDDPQLAKAIEVAAGLVEG